jgi:hypothetical protein
MLGNDERAVLDMLTQRLTLGQSRYGELVIDQDSRDWTREALEESLDLAIYLSIRLHQLDRQRGLVAAVDDLLSELADGMDNAWQGVGVCAVSIRALVNLKRARGAV